MAKGKLEIPVKKFKQPVQLTREEAERHAKMVFPDNERGAELMVRDLLGNITLEDRKELLDLLEMYGLSYERVQPGPEE